MARRGVEGVAVFRGVPARVVSDWLQFASVLGAFLVFQLAPKFVCAGFLDAANEASGLVSTLPDDAKFDQAIDEAYAAWKTSDWKKSREAYQPAKEY